MRTVLLGLKSSFMSVLEIHEQSTWEDLPPLHHPIGTRSKAQLSPAIRYEGEKYVHEH